jgi:hypothetical protein
MTHFPHRAMRVVSLVFGVAVASAATMSQPSVATYPAIPTPLADTEEIALARSAAPPEISDSATVLAVRYGMVRILRRGSSGSVCMVSRDGHPGSSYPTCFNPEGARTSMQRELLENTLRSLGVAEDSVHRAVDAAYAAGTIELPSRFAIAYMMSPRQVLFSSPARDGVRVGAWHPHVMIYSPNTNALDIGLAREGPAAGVIQLGVPGTRHSNIICAVPRWADGSLDPTSR